MPIVYCPHCHEPKDQDAAVCPHCGRDTPHPKEVLGGIIGLIVGLIFVALLFSTVDGDITTSICCCSPVYWGGGLIGGILGTIIGRQYKNK